MASLTIGRVAAALTASGRSIASSAARRQLSMLTAVDEFPDTPSLKPTPSKASTASVTTLSSGLIVVTEDSSPTTTVSLTFSGAGSSNETLEEGGASLINKCLAFKSASGLSSLLILRNLEDSGATPFSFAGRNGAGLGFTSAPDKAARLVPLLSAKCTFEKWDLRDAKKTAEVLVEDAMENAQLVLTEQLYAAAYGAQSPLGRPFHTTGASNPAIVSFRERTYAVNGAVLSATGVSDHASFIQAVQEGFAEDSTAAPASEEGDASPAYMGGEARLAAPSTGYSHMAIAFQGPSSNSALLDVMKHCLSFSCPAGASAFAAPGIIGVYGSSPAYGASSIADDLCTILTTSISSETIARAKNLAKAEALFALDGGSKSLAHAMTTSVLETGTFSMEETGAAYDSITPSDVTGAISAMLKSNPSVAAIGDISAIPYHATLAARFS